MYLKDQFMAADKSKNGFLFLNEFAALLKQLNINMEEEEIEKVFEEANTDKGTMVRAWKRHGSPVRCPLWAHGLSSVWCPIWVP